MRWKPHARCEVGENPEITSKDYLSLLSGRRYGREAEFCGQRRDHWGPHQFPLSCRGLTSLANRAVRRYNMAGSKKELHHKGYPAQGQQQNNRSEQDKRAAIIMIAARFSLSKNGLSGFNTRQAAKLKREKIYEAAVGEEGAKRFPAFHPASFLRFMATNLSLTQLETWARPR